MIDQAKRDEWADLAKYLEDWPTFWCPTFDDNGEWSGKWIGVVGDEPVVFNASSEGLNEDFAVMVASLVTCTPDMLGHIAKLESLYAAATSTADSLEAIGEAQIERARRHNAEVQAIVDGARMRHEEDAERIKALEAGLREACNLLDVSVNGGNKIFGATGRIVRLRKLAGEP